MKKSKNEIGEYFKKVRKANGLTQAAFALLLGKSTSAVTKYEIGAVMPTADLLIIIQGMDAERNP